MAAVLPPSRTLVRAIAEGSAVPNALLEGIPHGSAPDATALLARAIDAARGAGAAFAEAHYEVSQFERLFWVDGFPRSTTYLTIGIGVRSLYNGYWGYSVLTGAMSPDDAARMGREATNQAKTGAKGPPRTVELASRPVVTNGTWSTPGAIDPFSVSWGEKADIMNGIDAYVNSVPTDIGPLDGGVEFRKRTQTFAASDGASYSQTLYNTKVDYMWGRGQHWRTDLGSTRGTADIASLAGAGWEYAASLPAQFERAAARLARETEEMRFRKMVDIGRYDIVFDGVALASIVRENIGDATLLDRAMGYKANTVGTSYLRDPLQMLGTFQVGSPLLNVTADRSMPGGAATVKWDSEGVEPDQAVLVKDGILTDYQTTRESASWLAAYYQKAGKPVRSHGGAGGRIVYTPTEQVAHNLVVAPSTKTTSFEDLCSGVKKGLAVKGVMGNSADQQALNVESAPELVYEITNGKIGRVIGEVFTQGGALLMTRAPDFWKHLTALGDAQTVRRLGSEFNAGPATVSAPAALVTNVAVTTNTWRMDEPQ